MKALSMMDHMTERAKAEQRLRDYNRGTLSTLKPGDIVKFHRQNFLHFAIYVGDGYVIHKVGTDASFISPSGVSIFKSPQTVQVVEEHFLKVAGSDKADRDNEYDLKKDPLPAHEIVERAKSQLGIQVYQALYKNCEHFVYWCRYGEEFSQQSQLVKATVAVGSVLGGMILAGPIGGIAALSASAYMLYKHRKGQEHLLSDK